MNVATGSIGYRIIGIVPCVCNCENWLSAHSLTQLSEHTCSVKITGHQDPDRTKTYKLFSIEYMVAVNILLNRRHIPDLIAC